MDLPTILQGTKIRVARWCPDCEEMEEFTATFQCYSSEFPGMMLVRELDDWQYLIPVERLRQPGPFVDLYQGPYCHRCDRPGESVCVDDAGNEYDHHADEPVGAGASAYYITYLDKKVERLTASLHATGLAFDLELCS